MNERWDGTGPDGLKGSTIPLPSRIVVVCEAFDSLTNPLDASPPLSATQAMDELCCRSGTDFDPGVVEHFRDLALELERAAQN
jgi:HD-GYP domain-containing protein (c-di-GMP phosphodiesterase class II)